MGSKDSPNLDFLFVWSLFKLYFNWFWNFCLVILSNSHFYVCVLKITFKEENDQNSFILF